MLCIKTNRKGTNESLRSSKSVGKAPMKVMFNQINGYFCIFHISRNFPLSPLTKFFALGQFSLFFKSFLFLMKEYITGVHSKQQVHVF